MVTSVAKLVPLKNRAWISGCAGRDVLLVDDQSIVAEGGNRRIDLVARAVVDEVLRRRPGAPAASMNRKTMSSLHIDLRGNDQRAAVGQRRDVRVEQRVAVEDGLLGADGSRALETMEYWISSLASSSSQTTTAAPPARCGDRRVVLIADVQLDVDIAAGERAVGIDELPDDIVVAGVAVLEGHEEAAIGQGRDVGIELVNVLVGGEIDLESHCRPV